VKQILESVNTTWTEKHYLNEVSFARPHGVFTGSGFAKLKFLEHFSSLSFYAPHSNCLIKYIYL